MGKTQRRKGHNFERKTVRELKELGLDARRILEYQIENANGIDVIADNFVIQCKKGKKHNVKQAYKEMNIPDGKIGIARIGWDRELDVAVLSWEDFKTIIEWLKKEKVI